MLSKVEVPAELSYVPQKCLYDMGNPFHFKDVCLLRLCTVVSKEETNAAL